MSSKDKVTIGVRVTQQEFQALDKHCDKHGISKTELIRSFIRSLEEYMKVIDQGE